MTDTKTLFQHGTLALLVPGLYTGTITMAELLKHGDTGLGTLHDLDGEVVILKGHGYQINETGKVRMIGNDETLPFASVHYDHPQIRTSLGKTNDQKLKQRLVADYRLANVFTGIQINGTFAKMHTRVAPAQHQPYPPLTQVTKNQPEFNKEMVSGTIVGYFAPTLYAGATVGGFHWHFLSDDKQFGGHILDFELLKGVATLQIFSHFNEHLPIANEDFRTQDLDLTNLTQQIEQAEG